MKRESLNALFAYLTLCIVWGTTYLGIKIALEGFDPFFMVGVRFLIAGLLMSPVLLRKRAQLPADRKEWLAIIVSGICLLVGGNGLVTLSERYIASGVTALTVATNPAWAVLIGGWFFSREERYGKIALTGMLLAMAGVVLLHHNRLSVGNHDLPGVLAACASPILWATGSLIARNYIRRTDVLTTTALQMLAATIPVFLISLALGESWHVTLTARVVWAMVFLILIGSVLVYAAYVWLTQHMPISRIVTYTYINPVVALILGRIVLGEPIEAHVIPASALIIGGLLLIYFTRFRKAASRS
ncbi:MAG TPA: EamA family transporter [bacterium]|jgi:drug/metabolite transporter (DMT)-like permease